MLDRGTKPNRKDLSRQAATPTHTPTRAHTPTPTWRLGAVAALTLCLTQAAQAVTVYNNGAPNQVSGTNMSANVVAEDFSIGATTDISNLRFWSIQNALASYLGTVAWTVYSDLAAQPGAVLFSGTASPVATATGLSTGFAYAEYVFNIPTAFQLAAGTYWLGLANSPLNPGNPTDMLWETTSTATGSKGLYFDSGTWVDSGNDHAFLIEGAPPIPEPQAWALAAAGLLLMFGLLGRRQRSASPAQTY